MSKFTTMTDELHAYMVGHGARQDAALRRVQDETEAMGDIAVMQIAPDQGAFMTLLARSIGAREALEVGTFTGYSAICLARGLEAGGRLICCELSEEYAATAAANFEAAGVADRIEIRIGPALDTLRALPEGEEFDITFIDADKQTYPDYYSEALARTRPGGLVLIDNVLRNGTVVDPGPAGAGEDEQLRGTLKVNELVRDDDRVDVAMVGIADGLTIARKR
jgi:caffeoyl-CoA O-methyltransferase